MLPGCAEIAEDGTCISCSKGYFFSRSGECEQIDPQCAEFDENILECTDCYSGFTLISGVCELNEVEEGEQIENCAKYDEEGKCVECFDRFFLEEE